MKNIIVVDIDTDRNPVVQIGKPELTDMPNNEAEAKEMLVKDMACLTEALVTLIHAAHQSGYKDSAESLRDCIKHLEHGFIDNEYETNIKDFTPKED
jgi:hypothetical protein